MFQHEISQLNLAQLKAGEKRWIGNLQGSAAALLFKEIDGEVISLNYNKKTYTDFNEIQLLLFNLFDYKNIEYIDCYLQSKKNIQI